MKKRELARKHLIKNFLKFRADNPNHPHPKFMRFYLLVEKTKRNLKSMIRHNRLKYCIMNYQWAEFERQEIKLQKAKNLVSNEPKLDSDALQTKELVPIKVRLFYLREYSKYQFKKYFKDLKKWEDKCLMIKFGNFKDSVWIHPPLISYNFVII